MWKFKTEREKWALAAALAACLVSLASAIFTGLQWRSAERSVRVAEETARIAAQQFEVSERPWIKATPAINSPLTFDSEGNLRLAVSFSLTNVGHSVATEVTVYFDVLPIPQGEHFTKPLEQQKALCSKPRPNSLTTTVFPDETAKADVVLLVGRKEIEANIIPPPPGTFKPPTGKRISPVLFGCVDYRISSLPEHHQTGFIYNVNRIDPKTSSVPYLIVVDQSLPASSVTLEKYMFGGDYVN